MVQQRKRIPRAEAYEVYKAEDGSEWNTSVVEESNQLVEVKRAVKVRNMKAWRLSLQYLL